MVSIQPPPCPSPHHPFSGKGLHGCTSYYRGLPRRCTNDLFIPAGVRLLPCDHRLRLSRPALKLRWRRRLRWFHYWSLTSQRACYSYLFIYFCRLSFSPGLRHGEAKGAERRRIDWRRTECEKPLAAHLSLHPPPLASSPLPTRGTNWGVRQRICCRQTVNGVWAWLARGTVAGKPRNWSERPEDAGLDRFTSGKTHQDPTRIPPGSRLLGLPLRPQTRP